MIDKIVITNFQSHDKTVMVLHPGVNVIVGGSDAGKSAIIRALKWLNFNRPLGSAYQSSWGGTTKVKVELDDHVVIHWKRDGKNYYTVDGSEFNAVGSDVPDEITKILHLGELNFQGQVDPHFLFSSSPGEVAAQLNKVANLQLIDLGAKNLKAELSQIKSEIKNGEALQAQYTLELERYDILPTIEKKLKKIEVLDGQLVEIELRHRKLVHDLNEYNQAQKRIKTYPPKANELLSKIEQLLQKQKGIKQQHNELHTLQVRFNTVSSIMESARLKVSQLQERFEAEMPEVCPLCGK